MSAPLPHSLLSLLEELRGMAQLGLHYATGDAYDTARYQRLLELSAATYAEIGQMPEGEVLARFRREVGHITPKVGVDGAIFNEAGELLLVRRSDDGCWGLPAGWCDLNESPRQALARELREELNLEVDPGEVIEIFSRLPGDFGSPHTSYHVLMHAVLQGGTPRCQPEEILDWGWFRPESVQDWHLDHGSFAERAIDWHRRHSNG